MYIYSGSKTDAICRKLASPQSTSWLAEKISIKAVRGDTIMTTPPTNASAMKRVVGRLDTHRVRMAWFEHGASRIYYEVQGSGDPVLFLPGLFGSIEEFSGLREALVMAGYQVIAADLPGSGRSEPQPRAYSASYFEEDRQAFAALLQRLASKPAHLVG